MAKSTLIRLKFSSKLIGAPSKPLTTSELVKRLKALHTELAALEQETIDRDSLASIRKDLIEPSLLTQKDKGVKAYVACCLADLLRLYAPDAPYTLDELRDIFEFIVRQLQGIATPQDPFFTQYFYLLESLSTVKSAVLIVDLPNAEELMTDLFHDIFDNISSELSKNAQIYMVDILQQLIDECATVPQEILDIILAQFLQKRKSDKTTAAYQAAVTLCRNTADRLQKYVCQYFNDVIVKDPRDSNDQGDIKTAHELIKELNRVAPALLLNVIPQLEEEMKVDNSDMRLLATEVLGDMFSDRSSTLASLHPQAWNTWLQRRNDKSVAIRMACVNHVSSIIKNQPNLVKDVNSLLLMKLQDPDQNVRKQTCSIFHDLDYETALHSVEKGTLLELATRCRDSKQVVRSEAFATLGRLYSMAYSEIAVSDPVAIKHFSWIPNEIFSTLFINDTEISATVCNVTHENVLPMEADDTSRAERLLIVYQYLNEKTRTAFLANLTLRHKDYVAWMTQFIKLCELYNGGVIDNDEEKITSNLKSFVNRFSELFPVSSKASHDLMKFAAINDGRLYKLLKECANPVNDYKTISKFAKEFIKRIETSFSSIRDTCILLLRRSAYLILNKSIVPVLVSKLKDVPDESRSVVSITSEILNQVSTALPELYKNDVKELVRLVCFHESSIQLDEALEALANVGQNDAKNIPMDITLRESLISLAMSGSSKQAKNAVKILSSVRSWREQCDILAEKCAKQLKSASSSSNLVTLLATLKELALYAKSSFAEMTDAVTGFLVKELILKNRMVDVNCDESWVEDDLLHSECKAKMYALKVLTSRLRGDSTNEMAKDIAQPTFKLLWKIIETSGELLAEKTTPKGWQSRLRLTAAVCILQLAKYPVYERMITIPQFQVLAFTIQDSCPEVRQAFTNKLTKGLGRGILPSRFWTILCLLAFEPDESTKLYAKHLMMNRFRATRNANGATSKPMFETLLLRFLHLLAYHPDFSSSVDDLKTFAKFILFYLEAYATEENASLLFYLAARIKTVRDAQPEDRSIELYTLSDLTQLLIKIQARDSSWSLQTYPGNVKSVPSDLFSPIRDSNELQEIGKKTFLSDEAIQAIESMMVPRRNKHVTKKRSSESPVSGQKRMKSTIGKKVTSTKKLLKKSKKKNESTGKQGPRRASERTRSRIATYYENSESENDEIESQGEEDENSSVDNDKISELSDAPEEMQV